MSHNSSLTGPLIVVEGPSGIGKSTLAYGLAASLEAQGRQTLLTAQPSQGPLGVFARTSASSLEPEAVACLVAADRYQQQHDELRPRRQTGALVVCDRYVPSSLVLQVLDGVPRQFVISLNAAIDPATLYIFLRGDPSLARQRARARRVDDRFANVAPWAEAELYAHEARQLTVAGAKVINLPVDGHDATHVLQLIKTKVDRILESLDTSH